MVVGTGQGRRQGRGASVAGTGTGLAEASADPLRPPARRAGGGGARRAKKAGEWIERLFASQVYKDQKELVRRHAPEDEVVRRTLAVLEAGGGLMTPAAFAQAADIPAARLDGLVARIQRLLNVDGYEVLALNRGENKIELNVARLRRQFDLD